jgi:nickel-dependent lactate racemase
MNIHLQYGRAGLDVEFPSKEVTVIQPRFEPGLPDERAGFLEAVRSPLGTSPLSNIIRPDDRVAVVIPDATRPLPSGRILPWLFEELPQVTPGRFTIIIGTGSHRATTPKELESMLGRAVTSSYQIINHNAYDKFRMDPAGSLAGGKTVYLNKEFIQADKRIVLGFIEPHFMAGYSGGYKGVFPALADIDSIMHFHRASVIGDPRSSWGVFKNNPTQDQIRDVGRLAPADFCINVTMNHKREITRFFCGEPNQVVDEGSAFVRSSAMMPCPEPFPIVVTTNGGYPLDQNLYQTVKGMSAAAQIVAEGGLIVTASECNDGFPAHGNFAKLLYEHGSPQALLDTIGAPGFSMYDQWEAQLLALITIKARVALYSSLDPGEVKRTMLTPVQDIPSVIAAEIDRLGGSAAVAVLPEGPMTIPYLAGPEKGEA